MHKREHITVALIWSIALHLLIGSAAYHWLPDQDRMPANPSASISVALSAAAHQPLVQTSSDPAPAGSSEPVASSMETVRAVVMPAVDLNPAPRLHEPFTLDVASLTLQAPMNAQHRQSLQAALNQVVEDLPDWIDSNNSIEWQGDERHYQLTFERVPPTNAMSLERAVLRVETQMDGLQLEAAVPVTRMAFSHFAQVVDYWSPEVSLSGDRIDGRFHLNSPLHVRVDHRSKPWVSGFTTVAGRVIFEGPGRSKDIFPSGLQTRARPMPLPDTPIDTRAFTDGERIHRIAESAQLIFEADGGYSWQPVNGSAPPVRVTPGGYPWLVLAEEGVKLRVEGVMSGSVLVYSPERISITGNLRYAHDPRRETSGDFLGLVSDANVEIAAPDLTGPGDLQVDAAIFAGQQFRVRRYRNRDGGVLQIFGSVTAGSLSATEPRYTTALQFDPRLEEQRPAHFPMTDRYRIDAGEVSWTIRDRTTASAN